MAEHDNNKKKRSNTKDRMEQKSKMKRTYSELQQKDINRDSFKCRQFVKQLKSMTRNRKRMLEF